MNQEDVELLSERSSMMHDVLHAVYDLSDKIDANQAKAEKERADQRRIDRTRFWITFVVTLIGSLAAVGSLIATIVLN